MHIILAMSEINILSFGGIKLFLYYFCNVCVLSNPLIPCRAPLLTEAAVGENGEGEIVQPPERSFWAKYVSIPELVVGYVHKSA